LGNQDKDLKSLQLHGVIFNSAPLWGLIQGLFVGFGALLWKWIRGRGPILTMNHQVYPTKKKLDYKQSCM